MIVLSILICHLNCRAALLARLLDRLRPQRCDEVEILVSADDGERCGGKTTGRKRQELLQSAKGEYVAFIDDDDLVAEDYVSRILEALKENPDVVGFEGAYRHDGISERFIHSLRYDHWFEEGKPGGKLYFRSPNHLNPVRRSIAIQCGFPDKTRFEDREYSAAIFPLLKTEVFIPEPPIYCYLK